MRQLGWSAYMVDNAMTLAQKNKEQATNKDTKKGEIRRIIWNVNQENEETSNQGKSRRKVILYDTQQESTKADIIKSRRKILQEVCAETKLSDLSIAKETLREGLEEPEKNYEGKEA